MKIFPLNRQQKKTTRTRARINNVKKQSHPSISCYDLFMNGDRERKDMCPPCINYADLVPKTKPQHKMGIRFYGCHGPQNLCVPKHNPQAIGKRRILKDDDVHCVIESVPLRPQKKAKSCQLTPITPAELILGDANSGNEDAAVSTRKEIPAVSVELMICKERLKESLERQMNILVEQEVKDKNFRSIVNELEAEVKELEDSAKLKEKVYDAKIKKLKKKGKVQAEGNVTYFGAATDPITAIKCT